MKQQKWPGNLKIKNKGREGGRRGDSVFNPCTGTGQFAQPGSEQVPQRPPSQSYANGQPPASGVPGMPWELRQNQTVLQGLRTSWEPGADSGGPLQGREGRSDGLHLCCPGQWPHVAMEYLIWRCACKCKTPDSEDLVGIREGDIC